MICPGILRDTSTDESLFMGLIHTLDPEQNGATMVMSLGMFGEIEGLFCSAICYDGNYEDFEESTVGKYPDSGSSDCIGLRMLLHR